MSRLSIAEYNRIPEITPEKLVKVFKGAVKVMRQNRTAYTCVALDAAISCDVFRPFSYHVMEKIDEKVCAMWAKMHKPRVVRELDPWLDANFNPKLYAIYRSERTYRTVLLAEAALCIEHQFVKKKRKARK